MLDPSYRLGQGAVRKFRMDFEDDGEKSKWPQILGRLGAVALAATVAGFVAYPSEMISALKEIAQVFPKRDSENKTAVNGKSCNGVVVINCNANQGLVQEAPQVNKQPDAPLLAAKESGASTPKALPYVAQRDSKKSGPMKKHKEAADAFANSDAPIYRSIGPNDDLNLIGLDRFKPRINLCAFNMQLPCYMPPGFGRETIIREQED